MLLRHENSKTTNWLLFSHRILSYLRRRKSFHSKEGDVQKGACLPGSSCPWGPCIQFCRTYFSLPRDYESFCTGNGITLGTGPITPKAVTNCEKITLWCWSFHSHSVESVQDCMNLSLAARWLDAGNIQPSREKCCLVDIFEYPDQYLSYVNPIDGIFSL